MAVIDRERIKKTFPYLAESVRYVKRRKNELSALDRHLARKRFQKNNKQINQGIIKVVFICQYIPVWSKNKQLYETLRKDSQFEVLLLCVPNRISGNKLVDPEDMSNDTYEYFHEHGYKEVVNALVGKDEWFDLKTIHPDYVICNRTDRPMPLPYTSSVLATYTKIAFIAYGGGALLNSEEYMFDKTLVSNISCQFAESEMRRKIFLQWNRILVRLGLVNSYLCGRPSVENAYKAKEDPSPTWDFSKNSFRLIYAPRWTMEPAWGGSSFLKYKDAFIRIADNNLDMDILIRPHPLMFDHFISSGTMTAAEVDEYKTLCKENKNIEIDKEKEYLAAFWNSSVLACDYSSIIIYYFVTSKPIIYLTYGENIDYTDEMRRVLSACYIVNDEAELCKIIDNLKNGIDPLAEKRRVIYDEEFARCINTSENM